MPRGIRPGIVGASIACAGLLWLASPLHADEDSAKSTLQEKGLRITSTGTMLADEAEFNKAFAEAASLKRKFGLAQKNLAAAEAREESCKAEIRRLRQINVGLSAQLANLRNGDASLNNRLVGALNANGGQINLLMETQEKLQKQLDEVRKAANSAREAYVGRILELRPLSEKISQRAEELAADETVRAALAELNAATGKSYEVAPSRTFRSNVKRLEVLEKTVVLEKIPLRRQGNSFLATVVIDGEHTQEMIVDSGASLLTLPYRMAVDCGIKISDADPPITLVIADGSRISGRMKTLESVRVGSFVATDVECAVLGPEAVQAAPLLGMSFLGKFKFELNAQASELSLVRVDSEEGASRDAKRKSPAKTGSASKKDAADEKPPEPGKDSAPSIP